MRALALLRVLARNTSTEASLTRLAEQTRVEGVGSSAQTVRRYLDQLARVFVLDELPAWPVRLRSSIA